jgi:hypothetical protein
MGFFLAQIPMGEPTLVSAWFQEFQSNSSNVLLAQLAQHPAQGSPSDFGTRTLMKPFQRGCGWHRMGHRPVATRTRQVVDRVRNMGHIGFDWICLLMFISIYSVYVHIYIHVCVRMCVWMYTYNQQNTWKLDLNIENWDLLRFKEIYNTALDRWIYIYVYILFIYIYTTH